MSPLRSNNITLGSCLKLCGILLLIVFLVLYVKFQARNMLTGPMIQLSDSYETVQHTRSLSLRGTAKNIVKLTLNGKEIHTNEKGEFTEMLVLENGYTIMELDAQDRFGRTTSVERKYVYVPQS
jgi:hypothetical protein